MNKEEFKGIILRQFKEKGAPIHLLMAESDMEARTDNTYFKDNGWYLHSEYKLDIIINKTLDEEGFVRFAIAFKDVDEELGRRWEQYTEKDLSIRPYPEKLFYKEAVEITPSKLVFYIQPFMLTHRDYEFSISEGNPEMSLEYDFVNHQFMTFNPEVFVMAWNLVRKSHDMVHYLDYIMVDDDYEHLKSALRKSGTDSKRAKAIQNAFLDVNLGGKNSTLVKIVKVLQAIQ